MALRRAIGLSFLLGVHPPPHPAVVRCGISHCWCGWREQFLADPHQIDMRRLPCSYRRWTAGAAARLSGSTVAQQGTGVPRLRWGCDWVHPHRPLTRGLSTSLPTSPPSPPPPGAAFPSNVTPDILAKVGRSLHRKPHHPLCIIRERIIEYFQRRFPSPSSSFQFFDDLHPSVSIQQNFDDLLVPPLHPSRRTTDTVHLHQTHPHSHSLPTGASILVSY